MYRVLDREQQARMLVAAVQQLEAARFEAELNLAMADADDVSLGDETARARIERIDRQLARLLEAYGDLL
jgi:hypothetical protein